MFSLSLGLLQSRFTRLIFFIAGTSVLIALAANSSLAQRPRASLDDESRPAYSEFRGVRIGMTTDETRKKLGSPREKSAEQDFYIYDDTQVVQVYYDKTAKVSAISIDYMNGATGVPSAKDVLGTDADAKPDGSIYKMLRYPKAGYWVSYSRTAGNEPTVTITMQKIDH